jgi:hypothetical protein
VDAVINDWVFISSKSKVLHRLKPKPASAKAGKSETVCGRIVTLADLRDATELTGKCMQCWMKLGDEERTMPIMTSHEMLQLEKSKMQKVEGYVYCLSHGAVHDDTLDPFDEHPQQCLKEGNGTGIGVKREDVHRPVYTRLRAGDYPDA